MTSAAKRRNAKKRRVKKKITPAPFDIHVQHIMDSIESLEALKRNFQGLDDPVAAISEAFTAEVTQFVDDLKDLEPHRLIEIARMAYLPWTPPGGLLSSPEATAAHVELLALIALTAANQRSPSEAYPAVEFQEMSHFVSKASVRLNALLQLSHLRSIAMADPTNKLALIELLLRGSQVLVRHTSYAEMVESTLVQLFDGDAKVKETLKNELGFNASDAIAVLNACHDVQQDQMNARGQAFADAMATLMPNEQTSEQADIFRTAFGGLFEPDVAASTVSAEVVVAKSGASEATMRAVIERFRLDVTPFAPTEAVEAFMSGNNPMRTNPLIVTPERRFMLPHNTLTVDAVKESLEEHLKNSSAWNAYVKHRGELLEGRTRAALERVLPGAAFRNGFNYYVPANETELVSGDPMGYTKRAEGDHLAVLDDVALIVEDKAVALSALSKGGKTNRIRTDLTGIITKAAHQADRLRKVIERDGGVRIEGEGWVDLSDVREIYTVTVSLDDLTSITTATAELVRAEFLSLDNIPWTVSLHDLELITELVHRPAEFLLYLRRRTNPDATVMFSASDELDFFLFFFEDGFWIEPDPDQVREVFDWVGAPTTADRKRFREQFPAFITSRTDALDAWYFSKRTPGAPSIPKATMVASPLANLIDDLQADGVFGWLSIGATLLGAATATQERMARTAKELLDAPRADGTPRSLTMPLVGTVSRSEAWLLVWGTRPVGQDAVAHEKHWRDYVRSKKYQLGIPRGVVFLYDEGTRDLVDVYYEGNLGDLPAGLQSRLATLRPPSSHSRRLHPNAKHRPRSRAMPKR